jgi:branched-subunit amino acid transport protein
MSGMSTSSHTHRPHAIHASPAGWFGVAVAATFTALVVSAVLWSAIGLAWAAGTLIALVAVVGATAAARHGRDAAMAFVAGTFATVAGLYATLLVMAQFYAVAVQN